MWRKLLYGLLLLSLIGAGVGGYLYYRGQEAPLRYITASIEEGSITTTVNATGTVNAVTSVQVGSQVSGIIQKLFVDFNSAVQEDETIAQIDPAPLETKVLQARANLANAQAAVQVAQATIDNMQAAVETAQANTASAKANSEKSQVALDDARRTLERKRGLFTRTLIPQSELDVAQAAYDGALSQLKLSEAQYHATLGQVKSAIAQTRLSQAQATAALAQVEQTKAALRATELDLQHTTIRSPVKGIVIARNVDVGQTVAASLQAPTLFLIAQDLTQMQVDTNVSEADIGRVSTGQTATFTVDAYANTTFTGKVVQVRNAPITIQNVVTYNAVVQVANPDLRLKPGMTANVTFVIAERRNILKIPNAALRFQPEASGQESSGQESQVTSRGSAESGRAGGQELQRRLTQSLSLTGEQQTRLSEIMQRAGTQFAALREETSDERRRALRRDIQAATRTQIRDILTAEQRQKYEELLKTREERTASERQGKVWVLDATGILVPHVLTLGIANDTHAEMLAGDVTVGQQVVIGIATSAKRTRVSPPGFGGGGPRPF